MIHGLRRPPAPRWGSLTHELGRSASPVKAFFTTRFPNVGVLQRQYREAAGSLILPGSDILRGTMGAAFDWSVRFLLHPQPDLTLALLGAARLPDRLGDRGNRRLAFAIAELASRLGVETAPNGAASLGVRTFQGPAPASAIGEEVLLRGCWALALLTEVFRMGPVPLPGGSPLHRLDLSTVNADDLLDLASPQTMVELAELRSLALTHLLPQLSGQSGLWALGPTFDGSELMAADADFVVGGLLVELKTGLGDKRRDGTRRCGLEVKTLYQLLGYALMDFQDAFGLQAVGLYEARYGYLVTWPLTSLLEELASRPVVLAQEREQLRSLLLRGHT